MTVNEQLKLANNILQIIGVNLKLTEIKEINSNFFVFIFHHLFNFKPGGIIDFPTSEKDNYINIHIIIETLSQKVLHVPLSHIKPADINNKKETAVIQLLQIFQDLAEKFRHSKNSSNFIDHPKKRSESNSNLSIVSFNKSGQEINNQLMRDKDYFKLKSMIDRTDKQVDNLASLAGQTIKIGSERQQYLHKKIQQLLGPIEMVNPSTITGFNPSTMDRKDMLQEYVTNHKDNLILLQDRLMKTSPPSTTLVDVRQTMSDHFQKKNCIPFEDDLTCVTMNDQAIETCVDDNDVNFDNDNDGSYVSNETYVLDSRKDSLSTISNLNNDIRVKDAWAQVNKELVHQKYEQQFLDMLLEEEELIDCERDKCEMRGRVLRDFSQHKITCRPLSAFDEILQSEEDQTLNKSGTCESSGCDGDSGRFFESKSESARSQSQRNNSKITEMTNGNRYSNSNASGLVKPIIKQMGNHNIRKIPVPCDSMTKNVVMSSKDQKLITELLDAFPGLQLSDQTVRKLWNQASHQAASIQRAQKNFMTKLMPNEKRIEEARKRQELLTAMLHKEAMHQVRLQEKQEERQIQISTNSLKEKQRQQSARARRYLDEFSNRMRARMMYKQSKEEQVFRTMFNAALKIQRERIIEMQRYGRDVKKENLSLHQKDLDSLENYYRDRFAMLADSLRSERKKIKLQDRSQELAIVKLKNEMRTKLENDIRMIQDSMVQSQHDVYFRELDADNVVSGLWRK